MERRRYTRYTISNRRGLSVSVLLSGGSLIETHTHHTLELEGRALDLSEGGMCLAFDFDPDLTSLEPDSEVEVVFHRAGREHSTWAKIVHVHEGHRKIGVEFNRPLKDLGEFGLH